jgi:predicted Zn-dependent peptidase
LVKTSPLDHGATLITERLPQFRAVSLGFWVAAGSRHEAKLEQGLSHFLEHMMFKGTSRRSAAEIARLVDRAGGDFNAFTSREYTCFHILVLAQDVPLAVDILGDVLLNSVFDSKEISRERKVILQEIDMVQDNPEEVLFDELFEAVYDGHPLGRPILGPKRLVSRYNRQQIKGYFKKHYNPSHMLVTAAGPVDHRKLRQSLNDVFRRVKAPRYAARSGNNQKLRTHRTAAPRFHPGFKVMTKDTEQSLLVMAFPGLSVSDPRRFSLSVLNTHLGGGMSSRLFQEIREKQGLAYSVYSNTLSFRDTGLFTVFLGTAPGDLEKCLKIIVRELRQLKELPLTNEELQLVKESLKKTILINEDSVEGRMMNLARSQMFFGRELTLKEVFRAIDGVTAKQVQALARERFDGKNCRTLVLGPKLKDQQLKDQHAIRKLIDGL